MDVIGSVLKEQGVTFAVVQVDGYKVQTQSEAEDALTGCSQLFPGMPIVLMAVRGRSRPVYWGRDDLVRFISHVHPSRVPWRRYTFH